MNYLFLKLTKKTFLNVFLGMSLLFVTQGMQAATITSTAAGGDWNSTSTWVGGVVPANSTADYVIIVGTATVSLNLTTNLTVGALDINQGGRLNVSQDATARSFTLGILSPGSTIAGALFFDATVTGAKSFGKVTVTATGSILETTKVSISMNNGASGVLTNYGTITTATLAMSGTNGNLMKIDNYGTINFTGFSGATVGTLTNFLGGVLNFGGTVSGNIKNYGVVNSTNMSGSSAVASFTNHSTGVLNFTAGSVTSTTLILDASETGNTVNYSGTTQTVKDAIYSNLILSNSGTKTIGVAASATLATGRLTISGTAKANITNANLGANILVLGTTGQNAGTIGFTGSGATTINTAYFTTGTGTLNVQQRYAITSTAAGGDWNSASTWADGVVPANSSADYVVILGTATVNLSMAAATSVGALKINQGGKVNVSGNFAFTIASLLPYSEIAGTLLFDSTAAGTKSIGNITVTSTGSISSTAGATSIASTASTAWVNNGTITVATLGLTPAKSIENNGIINITSGIGSTSTGILNNNSGAVLNYAGSISGDIRNYGTINASSLSGTSAVAKITNYSSGLFNFTGGSVTSTTFVLDVSASGNTVNYGLAGSQTIFPAIYSNLTLSNSGTKTINTVSGTSLCTGTLTISGTAKANVANANVGVEKFFIGATGQTSGTHGFTGSGAANINTSIFVTGLGTLNVVQNLDSNFFTSTALGGDWNAASTWVGGIVPSSSTSSFVTIAANATVTLTLSAAFNVGALNINQGGKLNVSATGANAFTLGVKSPGSTISGELNFDNTVTATKSIGNITVTSTGVVRTAIGATSIASNATAPWLNNGTISIVTLGLSTGKTIDNNGTFTCTGIGSTSQGVFNNNSGAVFNLTGAVAGTINNYGTFNSAQLSGSAAVASLTNYSTGIVNFSGVGMYSTTFVLDATTPGNAVNYTLAGDQLIKATSYSNLSLSGSGYKNVTTGATLTIPVNGALTINAGVVLNNSGIINNLGTITNNGDIVQNSNAAVTASLLSTSSISNVTQQRYFTSNQRGWRLISNPLSSTTFDTLATASNITVRTNFTGEYISASNTWTSTDATATMDNQKAYKVFITGLAGESAGGYVTGPSNVTLVNKGTAANTAPAAVATVAGQYYLVANPYTAPVSVASIIAASAGLSSTVSYYNPANGSMDVKIIAGGFDFPVVSGVAGSATDVVIPPMGAIFVYATSDGTINVPKSVIFTGTPAQTGTFSHKTAQPKSASTNKLKGGGTDGTQIIKKLVIE